MTDPRQSPLKYVPDRVPCVISESLRCNYKFPKNPKGVARTGTRCKNRASHPNGRCWRHVRSGA